MSGRKPWASPAVVTFSPGVKARNLSRLLALVEEGLSAPVIAQRLGVHVNTVWLWILRFDLRRSRRCARCGRRLRGCRGHRFVPQQQREKR